MLECLQVDCITLDSSSSINTLFYLTFDIRVNVDVISRFKVFGVRLCDRRLKASG